MDLATAWAGKSFDWVLRRAALKGNEQLLMALLQQVCLLLTGIIARVDTEHKNKNKNSSSNDNAKTTMNLVDLCRRAAETCKSSADFVKNIYDHKNVAARETLIYLCGGSPSAVAHIAESSCPNKPFFLPGLNVLLCYCGFGARVSLAKQLLCLGANDIDAAMQAASSNVHDDVQIVDFFLSQGPSRWSIRRSYILAETRGKLQVLQWLHKSNKDPFKSYSS